MTDRDRRLRSRLLAVLLCDTAGVGALGAIAIRARSRRAGSTFSAIAGTGAASLLPAVVAVVRERRAHRRAVPTGHGMRGAVLLLAAGVAINTVGTIAVLLPVARSRPLRATEIALDIALLVCGDAIGVPYLALVRALHAGR